MVETGGAEIFVEQNVLRVRGVTITRVLAVLELCILVEAGESGGEDLAESRGDAKAEQHRHRPRGAAGQRGKAVDVDYSLPHLTKPMTTPGLASVLWGNPLRYVPVLIIC